jgi:hypothetical protein
MATSESDPLFSNPFNDDLTFTSPKNGIDQSTSFLREMTEGALRAIAMLAENLIAAEDVHTINKPTFEARGSPHFNVSARPMLPSGSDAENQRHDLVVSLRLAFSGFVASLIDSAPSEICLISLTNLNSIATWNTSRTADATLYFTVTSLQVDNMVPNAPFPVAVAPSDILGNSSSTSPETGPNHVPLLVVGISLAPQHQSGIVVSNIVLYDSSSSS